MECFALHVDLIDSSKLLRGLALVDRSRLSICCESTLRLLMVGLDVYDAQISFAGDGGFCLLHKDQRPEGQIHTLLAIAQAFPSYVNFLARPPVLSKTLPYPVAFRRGISLIPDLPAGPNLRIQNIGSIALSDALKHERDWADRSGKMVTLWHEVYEHIRDFTRWPATERKVTYGGLSRSVHDLVPPIDEAGTVASHLVALEDSSVFWLQQALEKTKDASAGLHLVFEPRRYAWETTTAIKNYFETDFSFRQKARVAYFLVNEAEGVLKLFASAADKEHTVKNIPLNSDKAAARAYKEKRCCVFGDTSKEGFIFDRTEQEALIRSHLSIPIVSPKLVLGTNQVLPVPDENQEGAIVGVLSIDSQTVGAFSHLVADQARILVNTIRPLWADLLVASYLARFQGWSNQ